MDLQRLFLFLIFVFSLGLVWDGWQRHQHPELYVQQSAAADGGLPKPQAAPAATSIPTTQPPTTTAQAAIAPQPVLQATGKTIRVKTDILEAEISTIGQKNNTLSYFFHTYTIL